MRLVYLLFHNIYLTFLALKKSFLKKKMATYSLDFPKLDSNDVWLDECGAANCRKAHNILNNEVMLRPTSNRLMNWWDFLDVLVCYAESAKCGLCCKCNWCLYYFRNLWSGRPRLEHMDGRGSTAKFLRPFASAPLTNVMKEDPWPADPSPGTMSPIWRWVL